MSTTASTIDYLLDQMAASGVSARKMFGEYTLYCNTKVVGLVCDDNLYIKITAHGKTYVDDHYREEPPYQGAKPAMLIDESLIEDSEWLCELISITEKGLPKPKPKSPKKKHA